MNLPVEFLFITPIHYSMFYGVHIFVINKKHVLYINSIVKIPSFNILESRKINDYEITELRF